MQGQEVSQLRYWGGANCWNLSLSANTWDTGWPFLRNKLVKRANDYSMVISVRSAAHRAKTKTPPELVTDAFDFADNVRLFLLEKRGFAAGTIRISHVDRHALSTCLGFREELSRHIKNAQYIEITHLAARASSPLCTARGAMALMQNATAEADDKGCRYMIAAMSPKDIKFYSRLGFTAISCPKLLSEGSRPVTLGCLDWSKERARLRRDSQFRWIFSSRNTD